jgi:hypothetical protein
LSEAIDAEERDECARALEANGVDYQLREGKTSWGVENRVETLNAK